MRLKGRCCCRRVEVFACPGRCAKSSRGTTEGPAWAWLATATIAARVVAAACGEVDFRFAGGVSKRAAQRVVAGGSPPRASGTACPRRAQAVSGSEFGGHLPARHREPARRLAFGIPATDVCAAESTRAATPDQGDGRGGGKSTSLGELLPSAFSCSATDPAIACQSGAVRETGAGQGSAKGVRLAGGVTARWAAFLYDSQKASALISLNRGGEQQRPAKCWWVAAEERSQPGPAWHCSGAVAAGGVWLWSSVGFAVRHFTRGRLARLWQFGQTLAAVRWGALLG